MAYSQTPQSSLRIISLTEPPPPFHLELGHHICSRPTNGDDRAAFDYGYGYGVQTILINTPLGLSSCMTESVGCSLAFFSPSVTITSALLDLGLGRVQVKTDWSIAVSVFTNHLLLPTVLLLRPMQAPSKRVTGAPRTCVVCHIALGVISGV